VLWDTSARPEGNWSTVRTQSEAAALERAEHFVKLGFTVHAIKDPSGLVFMDAETIAGRFRPAVQTEPDPEPSAPSDEQSARDIVRGFVEDHQAVPGRMLAAATLRSLLTPRGLTPIDFERAVSFAKDHGWVGVADGILTLTQAGYVAATA
jgi:hypothetical protein